MKQNISRSLFLGVTSIFLVAHITSCSSSSETTAASIGVPEDTSASGAAASAVGGALGGSASGATLSRFNYRKPMLLLPLLSETAHASGVCPTLLANSSGCASPSANVVDLTYSECSFGSSLAMWNGILEISFASGTTALACNNTFPTVSGDVMQRQFVAAAAAATGTRTSAAGNVVTIDDRVASIVDNYQTDSFTGVAPSNYTFTPFHSGGGEQVGFTAAARTSVTVVEELVARDVDNVKIWDHTVAGTVNVAEQGSGAGMTWTANVGTITSGLCSSGITVYHNLVKMMGTTCFHDVVYTPSCCTPTQGTIVTTFAKTSKSPTNAITNAMNGVSETLTITGCGTATYTDYLSRSSSVSLGSCF